VTLKFRYKVYWTDVTGKHNKSYNNLTIIGKWGFDDSSGHS